MDKRTWLFLLLTLATWYVWLAFFAPPPERGSDELDPASVVDSDTPAPAAPAAQAPEAAEVPARDEPVTLCRSVGVVNTGTGALRDLRLLDYEAPYDVQPLWSWALSGFDGPWKPYGDPPGPEIVLSDVAQGAAAGAGPLSRPAPPSEVVEAVEGRVVTRGVTPEGVEVTRVLQAEPGDPCRVRVDVTWRNTAAAPFTGGLWVGMHDVLREQTSRYALAMRPRALVDGDVEGFEDMEELATSQALPGPVGWFGMADAYFAAFMVPTSGPAGQASFSSVRGPGDTLLHGVHYVVPDALAPGTSTTASFLLYTGPKQGDALEAYHPLLEEAVELGFLSFLAWPLLELLKFIHGIVGNWGLAIIMLTFLVKLLFFRLTQRAFESGQAMQAIQPQLVEIREQYKDNPEELNRRTIALFQESGVNPLGGCLPMFVQAPVWIALFTVLMSSVELYHIDFLYVRDLSAIDPYMIGPAVVMGIMFLQQQMIPMQNMDPAQARMMKLMPLIFGLFFFTFPAGLVLYTFVNVVLSILQQWYIKKTFKGPKIATAG